MPRSGREGTAVTTTTTGASPVIDLGPSGPAPAPVTGAHPSTGGTPTLWPAGLAVAAGLVALAVRRRPVVPTA